MELNVRQRKILKGAGIAAAIGLGLHLINKYVVNRAGGDQEEPPTPRQEENTETTPAPKVQDIAKTWAPDSILSYGSKRKRMVMQLQHVINAIARLKKEPQIEVDGVWGNKTQAKVIRYFGKNQVTYNRARSYASQLYAKKGLIYPSGKPLPNPAALINPSYQQQATSNAGTWFPDFPQQETGNWNTMDWNNSYDWKF